MFIHFGANILLGAVILVIGFWLANVVANVVQRGEYNSSRWLASLVRVLIIGLVLALGLRAMGIADSIVNLAFGLTLGAVAVAFALAFGLGGRQPAERLLTDLLDKAKKEANQPNPLYQPPSSTNSSAPATTTSTTPSAPTTPPSTAPSDAKPADSVQVNPAQPPVNKPFGSTGENDEI
jgi:predicted lipid-binding transport protein (Tim44 family)